MKDLRMKIALSVLLIIAGVTLSNYSNISTEIKHWIALFCTVAGLVALIKTIMSAKSESK